MRRNRRSFLRQVIGSVALAGGAVALVAGRAHASGADSDASDPGRRTTDDDPTDAVVPARPVPVNDADKSDPENQGAGPFSDSDPHDEPFHGHRTGVRVGPAHTRPPARGD